MEAIKFKPLYMERIWGGRKLETIYGRELPDPERKIGEAWEIVDREDAQSIVEAGPLRGKSLHDLWTHHRDQIFGANLPESKRFPLLIKILDCSADLSIQVHPPQAVAAQLGGEAKTEMWFIADREPGAKLYVGLKQEADRKSFARAIQDGTVAGQVHSIRPEKGDSIFIPSGRLHAIGAGFLIHEIQQNSDTTYRVFDWNRTDDCGQPRELHIEESMRCIDFDDKAPEMDQPDGNTLASCEYFTTTRRKLAEGESVSNPDPERFSLITVVSGSLENRHEKGRTILLPRAAPPLNASEPSEILQITIPRG